MSLISEISTDNRSMQILTNQIDVCINFDAIKEVIFLIQCFPMYKFIQEIMYPTEYFAALVTPVCSFFRKFKFIIV